MLICGAHLCTCRYGASTVSTFFFECWNEPNGRFTFWSGTEEDYYALYEATAAGVKQVLPSARVGGYVQERWSRVVWHGTAKCDCYSFFLVSARSTVRFPLYES